MDNNALSIRMLGGFSIRLGDMEINGADNRSKKVWLLLAYMICCRSRSITQDELIELLWSDEESSSNPVNALKTMFHRVRAMLDGLGQGVGHRLIIRRDGSYAWNPDVVFTLDIDDFEALCASGDRAQGNEERLDKYMRALSLYDGDFLPGSHRKPGSCPGAPGCTSFSYAPRSLRQTCWSVRIVRLKFRISARAPWSWNPIARSSTFILCAPSSHRNGDGRLF